MTGRLLLEVAYEMALKVNGVGNEAIFASCISFWAIDIIQKLENTTWKPVVPDNQATFW